MYFRYMPKCICTMLLWFLTGSNAFWKGSESKRRKSRTGRRAISVKDLHSSLLYNLLVYHTGLLVMMAGQLISMIVPQP